MTDHGVSLADEYTAAIQDALASAHGLLAAIKRECAENGDGTVATTHGRVKDRMDDLRESLAIVRILDEKLEGNTP